MQNRDGKKKHVKKKKLVSLCNTFRKAGKMTVKAAKDVMWAKTKVPFLTLFTL